MVHTLRDLLYPQKGEFLMEDVKWQLSRREMGPLLTWGKDRCYDFSSHRSSKIGDNYLKELNEDLKIRKQELTEMLKPLKDKNNLLFQKLMSNLDEKQKR